MVSPRKRILADRPRLARRQGASKLGAVKLRPQCESAAGADISETPGMLKVGGQPQRAAPAQDTQQCSRRDLSAERAQPTLSPASAPAAKAGADAEFADWGSGSFGFDPPAASRPGASSAGHPAKQHGQPRSSHASPNLLGPLQRGFKAFIDGEAYVSERGRAAKTGLGIDAQPSSPEPSLLNKGLDAFNAVSRAAVGVATSLDTHIEQLMEQHGWADSGARAVDGSRRTGPDSTHLGRGADASLYELPGLSDGTTLFSGAATAVLSDGKTATRSHPPSDSREPSGGGSRKQSPNVAEKAAAHMAALLPDFRPKETVNEFLSEVQQVFDGSLFGLERQRQQGSGSLGGLQLDLPEWGTDSGVFSSLANSISSSRDAADADAAAAAEVAAHAQRLQAQWSQQRRQQDVAAADCRQVALSPTADKENQGKTQGRKARGGAQHKAQPPAGIDWQDFLSGESQVLQPAPSSHAASVSSGCAGLSRQASAQPVHGGCLSPSPPATPQQHGEASSAPGQQQQDEAGPAAAPAATAPVAEAPAQPSAQQEPLHSQAISSAPTEATVPATAGHESKQPPMDPQGGPAPAVITASLCKSPARHPASPQAPPPLSPSADPIAEQVRVQLEALVAEKSALAQENARLQRENTNLQELLSYTTRRTGSGSTVGSDDEDALSDWSTMEAGAACPSIDNGVSPVKMARRRLSMSDVEDEGALHRTAACSPSAQGPGRQLAFDESIPDISAV